MTDPVVQEIRDVDAATVYHFEIDVWEVEAGTRITAKVNGVLKIDYLDTLADRPLYGGVGFSVSQHAAGSRLTTCS